MQILFFIIFLGQLQMPVQGAAISNHQNTEAIYGSDNRKFVDLNSSPKIKSLSRSVGLIVSRDFVVKNRFSSNILADKLTDSGSIGLCQDELFSNHLSLNSCTGFLIGEDLMASAGHCFKSIEDCERMIIAFDVLAKNEKDDSYKVSNRNLYECSSILSISEGDKDFAVIRLNKKVVGRSPLKINSSRILKSTEKVFMIGHPLGMALMATEDAAITDNDQSNFFKTRLDSFSGNSGSPVFNSETFEVEGILVKGEEDFLQDSTRGCYLNQVYLEEGSASLKGEVVNRIQDIKHYVSK